MITIIYDDNEIGVEDQTIGKIHYTTELTNEATGYDVIDTIVRVMRVAGYQEDTIKRALEAALGLNENED